jgi:hypothetical protein
MSDHAITFVKWDVFRSGAGERYSRGYLYACKRPRLLKAVEQGDTLWLVTSRRTSDQTLRYHLAYKLVDCDHADPSPEKEERFGRYMVCARDWGRSVHFPYNDVTSTLRRLRCVTGRPLWEETNLGNRLTVSIPRLTPEDIMLMEAFQQRILTERTVFLSYSRQDAAVAARLETELAGRNVHVYRDVQSLYPGEPWQPALERAVRAADSFVVLISPASGGSAWVKQEVAWVLNEQRSGGLVAHIVPLLLPTGGWEAFPELHHLHRVDYPVQPDAAFFDRLTEKLEELPR